MTKQKTLLVIGLSILLSGCGLSSQKSASVEMTNKNEAKQAERMAQIMERGGSAVCVATQTSEEGEVTTTMKISGKKMRMEGMEMGEEDGKGVMINDGVYSYMWSESKGEGIKVKLPTEQEIKDQTKRAEQVKNDYANTGAPSVDVKSFEDESKYKVVCNEQKIADSEFVPPATVKFLDTSEMMKGLPAGMPSGVMDKLPK